MHVLIIGAAGLLGRRLSAAIGRGDLAVSRLTLADLSPPAAPVGLPARRLTLSLAERSAPQRLLADRPDLIFHLAGLSPAEAEAEPEKAYALHVEATRALFEAIRRLPGYRPRLILASTLAVFGPPCPDRIPDDFAPRPVTSYGSQKLMAEALLNDLCRRGALDGIALRLPTLCIRPGPAGAAATDLFSTLLRDPLAGYPTSLPVPADLRHVLASPRAATGFLLHAAQIDTAVLGADRALTLPGLSASVQDLLAALRDRQGARALSLIRAAPDPRLTADLARWPPAVEAARAQALGFAAEIRVGQLIDAYLQDDAPFLRR
ncbi:NAD-dependent epimerase/dehydratase family protein [Xinfangfangia pollutisoli]|uniref:NAD-dependent epimerase/dehydratase family protein n=1 Tax=Xinfangfangia pollutisoli TaxID=2865960 RepID=UPI001CD719D0|nr:NAD-dependent epimerase/dehydratase family protein [Xinfangfangia pollutisoli]